MSVGNTYEASISPFVKATLAVSAEYSVKPIFTLGLPLVDFHSLQTYVFSTFIFC